MLVVTGDTKGTSMEKCYDKLVQLVLESLRFRQLHGKLIFFYEIVNNLLLEYLQSYLKSSTQNDYPLRSESYNKIKFVLARPLGFKPSFFLFCIEEWSKLETEIWNVESIDIIKKLVADKLSKKSLFSVNNHYV